jgi:UDP-glucoronosyl and UDP-glucosyl transferase
VADFIEDSNGESDGFVYIGFGTIVHIPSLPQEKLQIFWEVLRSFPRIKFLFKWVGEPPRDSAIPKNVLVHKWFSQQDVLGEGNGDFQWGEGFEGKLV